MKVLVPHLRFRMRISKWKSALSLIKSFEVFKQSQISGFQSRIPYTISITGAYYLYRPEIMDHRAEKQVMELVQIWNLIHLCKTVKGTVKGNHFKVNTDFDLLTLTFRDYKLMLLISERDFLAFPKQRFCFNPKQSCITSRKEYWNSLPLYYFNVKILLSDMSQYPIDQAVCLW